MQYNEKKSNDTKITMTQVLCLHILAPIVLRIIMLTNTRNTLMHNSTCTVFTQIEHTNVNKYLTIVNISTDVHVNRFCFIFYSISKERQKRTYCKWRLFQTFTQLFSPDHITNQY